MAAEEIGYSVISSFVAFGTILIHDYLKYRNTDELIQREYWMRTLVSSFLIIFLLPLFVEIAEVLKDGYDAADLHFDPVPLCFQAAMVAGIFSYKKITWDWRYVNDESMQKDGWLQSIWLVLIVFVVWTIFLTVLVGLVPEAEGYYMKTLEHVTR
ncbi:MAG: hypothetical protein ACE5OZ_17335 [Candidatus Heimdallarchaeota archaeon]